MPESAIDQNLWNQAQAFANKKAYSEALAMYEKLLAFTPDDETIKTEYVDIIKEYGEELSFDDNHEQAKEILEKALKVQGEDEELYTSLGREYDHLDQKDKAIEFFEKALQANADSIDANLSLSTLYEAKGELLLTSNKTEEAIESFLLAIKHDPLNKYANYDAGRAYYQKGSTSEAATFFREAIKIDPSYIDPYIYLGNILLDNKEYDESIKQYQAALKYNATYKYALFNLGVAYTKKGEPDLAILSYENAIKSEPAYYDAYHALANLFLAKSEDEKAIQTLNEAFKLDPKNKTTLKNLASIYKKQGNQPKALEFYQLCLNEDPTILDCYIDMGNILLEMKEFEKAVHAYEEALKYDNNYKYSLFNLGVTYSRKSDTDKAIIYYERAIASDPKYFEAFNALGNVYDERNEFDKAIEKYNDALAINDAFKYPHFNKGVAYTKKGEITLAIDSYRQAIVTDPKYSDAYVALGGLFQNTYQLDSALMEYTKAADIIRDSDKKEKLAEAYYSVGNVYLDKLDYEGARCNYDKALQADPSYVFPQHNKAWIYEKLGQYKTAKVEWNKAKGLYSKAINNPDEKPGPGLGMKYFYYAEILNYYIDENDPEHSVDKIKSYYQQAIEQDKASIFFRLSLLKFCMKEKSALEISNPKHADDELQAKINEFHIQALHEFRTGIDLLKKKIEKKKDKFDLADLGEFYLAFEQYNDAAICYEEAIQLDVNFIRGMIGLGVAQSKLDNYTEAIKSFKKALIMDPDDLNVQSNLADAYLKSGKLSLAEEVYKKILRTTACHIEAMLGLAEHYKMLADKQAENGKLNDSEEYLKQSLELYEKILEKNDDFYSSSRRLTNDELSLVNYSLGYIKVKLYEIHEGLGFRPLKRFDRKSHLKSALKCFTKIREGQPDYYKAQTAIKKIDKQFALDAQAGRKSAPLFIFLLSLFICLTMQFFFWVGRPGKKDVVVVNTSSLDNFISKNKLDDLRGKIHTLAAGEFNSIKELEEKLQNIPIQEAVLKELGNNTTEKKATVEFLPMDPAPYALITFGALIFMVVGLFLRDISKLKVGSIELEKTTSDTISTSPNLGIGR